MLEQRFTPETTQGCRYVLSVSVGATSIEQECPSLEAAEGAFNLFKERERDNRDAHGGIYDREKRSYCGTLWRGGPKRKAPATLTEIYERLIAKGEPVDLIGPRGSVRFNQGGK